MYAQCMPGFEYELGIPPKIVPRLAVVSVAYAHPCHFSIGAIMAILALLATLPQRRHWQHPTVLLLTWQR